MDESERVQRETLQKNYDWFLENREGLLKSFEDKVLVIVEQSVRGTFADDKEAYEYGVTEFGLGNFLIQKCSKVDDVQRYYSPRVRF